MIMSRNGARSSFGLIEGRCGGARESRKNGRPVIRRFAIGHGSRRLRRWGYPKRDRGERVATALERGPRSAQRLGKRCAMKTLRTRAERGVGGRGARFEDWFSPAQWRGRRSLHERIAIRVAVRRFRSCTIRVVKDVARSICGGIRRRPEFLRIRGFHRDGMHPRPSLFAMILFIVHACGSGKHPRTPFMDDGAAAATVVKNDPISQRSVLGPDGTPPSPEWRYHDSRPGRIALDPLAVTSVGPQLGLLDLCGVRFSRGGVIAPTQSAGRGQPSCRTA